PPTRSRPTKRPPPPSEPQPKPSALALQNNISASTERSIHEAFTLFANPSSPSSSTQQTLPSTSLSPALKALGLKSRKRSIQDLLDAADPDDSGSIPYETFLAVAALKLNAQSSNDDNEEEKAGEIEEAFQLFLGEGRKGGRKTGEDDDEGVEVITMQTLNRVAKILKEDVDEKVLRDMILEANGGAGVRKGVGRREFGEVMMRAGVLK
ncbi:MAG: hypothetical protein Q9204_008865, partial [Flavoplaca sp. TL-2023a]